MSNKINRLVCVYKLVNIQMELLPDELFENVCRYLSPSDLQTMMFVDSYSRCIIENSPVLMDKLPLYVTDGNDEFCDEYGRDVESLIQSRRKVRKVKVKLTNEKIVKYLGIFQKFGHTIRTLDIDDYAFETIDQLRIILRFLPRLETLIVTNVTFQRGENKILNSIVQVPKIWLNEIRNVVCVNSDPKVFSLFTPNQDTHLSTIRLEACDASSFHYYDFIEMINQQTDLKRLTLNGITEDCTVFDYHNLAVTQLETLEIENCFVSARNQIKNVVEMIKNQRKLKVLKILNAPMIISSQAAIYRQIFAHNITEVHVDIRNLLVFHSHRFVNETVTKLFIHGHFAYEFLPVFSNFIKMFPNTVQLSLVGDTPIGDKYLYHILSTLTQLEELQVPGFTSRAADSNFSNLSYFESKIRTLVLDFIDSDVKFFGWKNIVSNLRTVEKLIVKRDYGKVSSEIIDLIIKNLALTHLELGIGVVSEKILQNIVHSDYCNQLKVLKIAKVDFEKIGENFAFVQLFERNHLLLHLCENEYFLSTNF